MSNIYLNISTNIHPLKIIKGSMGQLYPCSTIWDKDIVAILNIYGSRAIFLLFCDHQDNESESQDIELGVSGTRFNHKKYQRL